MVLRLAIIALIVLVFIAAVSTYTVRFNELAITTTFGRADESSVIKDAGLHWKIPYVQRETKYDKRTRFLQSDQETQQTQDGAQVILTSYLTWKINDPLKFYQRFSGAGDTARDHYREADKLVKANLRSAMSEVSKFRLDQLVSATEQASRIADLEKQVFARVNQKAEGNAPLAEYGIEPVSVGISGFALPQETTKSVFERMKASRLKIANETKTQGASQAGTIKASAEADAKRISSFAEQLARSIRTQGDKEAAAFLTPLGQEPELAVFWQNMEFMKQAYGKTTTFIFPTSLPGFKMFRPDALESIKKGEIPKSDISEMMTKPTAARIEAPGEPAKAEPAKADQAPTAAPLQAAAPKEHP